jgi:hypothetical protein
MMEGGLFTRDFLLEGIRETDVRRSLDDIRVAQFCTAAKSMLDALAARKNPNEAQTEEDLGSAGCKVSLIYSVPNARL